MVSGSRFYQRHEALSAGRRTGGTGPTSSRMEVVGAAWEQPLKRPCLASHQMCMGEWWEQRRDYAEGVLKIREEQRPLWGNVLSTEKNLKTKLPHTQLTGVGGLSQFDILYKQHIN